MSTPIGKKIQILRESLNMRREDFAVKTGIPIGTLTGIEQGRHEPKHTTTAAIASQWPEYAAYLLTDKTEVAQKNPEVEKLARELPKASAG